ncbi:MAG: cytidylate kinase-like family protein, partial [Pseudomonadota bacterium]
MPIITVSRGTFSGGRELAETLARKLGVECIESEVLQDAAREFGVPVARLQAAMLKPPAIAKRMGHERDMYLSCITAALCERARGGDLVYHGHAGHLLLRGVSHVMRVRVVADPEFRIKAAMARMNLDRGQARKYIKAVDEDRCRWTQFLYAVDWTDPLLYDFFVNLEHVGVANAATALCAMAELPDFKPTPASILELEDLLLASRARICLWSDERTERAEVSVHAHRGVVTVRYMPQQAELVPCIPAVLERLEGLKEVHCTIASTSLLWIQDKFSPSSDAFGHVVDLAQRWDSSVELLQLVPAGSEDIAPSVLPAASSLRHSNNDGNDGDGGVILDTPGEKSDDEAPKDSETAETREELRRLGRCGGMQALPTASIPGAVNPSSKYSLVVVGEAYGDRPHAVRSRLKRELRLALADHLNVPVVGVEELRRRLQFGPRQVAQLVASLATVVATYLLVFSNEAAIMTFIRDQSTLARHVFGVGALMLAVPVFA